MKTASALAIVGTAGALWWLSSSSSSSAEPDAAEADVDELDYDDFSPLDDALATYDNFTGSIMETISPINTAAADDNLQAFLATIRAAEGTSGPNGYRTLFGGGLFSGYADHPRIAKQFTDQAGRRLWTSAAGAYQMMAVSQIPTGGATRIDTWDRLKRRLGLTDFAPASQDAAAIELIREAGALYDVRAGRFADAISKVRKTWASLPGAGYAQPERSLASLASVFESAGGTLA